MEEQFLMGKINQKTNAPMNTLKPQPGQTDAYNPKFNPCYLVRNTEQKVEGMDKMKLIKILSQMIQQISDKEEAELHWKEGKIKFRQYERIDGNQDQIHAIDVTIEA